MAREDRSGILTSTIPDPMILANAERRLLTTGNSFFGLGATTGSGGGTISLFLLLGCDVEELTTPGGLGMLGDEGGYPESCEASAPANDTEAECRWSSSEERGRIGDFAGMINVGAHYFCGSAKRDLQRYAENTYKWAIYQAEDPSEFGHTHFGSPQTTHTWSGTDDEVSFEEHLLHEVMHKFFSDDAPESAINAAAAACSPFAS